ncbi:MAG: GGDEF domain-containing protein [Xanthobacteraceae bacterium]
MLSVPTLWTVFVINFLALGLIWGYVARSYPRLEAARFWTGSAFAAALGASAAVVSREFGWIVPLLCGGAMILFAICLAAMGVQRFYDRPVSWRGAVLLTVTTFAAMVVFTFVHEDVRIRVLIYSLAEAAPFLYVLRLLLSSKDGRAHPGARLAGIVAVLILVMFAVRPIGQLVGLDLAFAHSGPALSVTVLLMMFLSMSINFGFLLMAVDRLRSEVADLALLDDLTGVGNRRHLLQRLTEECARSERSGEPFALLVIDLDGFKLINDTHGHAAGDACLQHFTLMAQTRLRPGDMLARTGGDEFCVVLPASTLREGAMIARRILDVCRADAEACVGDEIPISLSIGVAQWNREIGPHPDRLMAAADHALYAAKKDGKNRHAVYDPAPPLAPSHEPMPQASLRKLA